MEVKKARRADLEKGKSRWLFMGLIVTLSFMFVSFEWTERNVTYAISDLVSDPDFFEELVPVTYNQDKPLPRRFLILEISSPLPAMLSRLKCFRNCTRLLSLGFM